MAPIMLKLSLCSLRIRVIKFSNPNKALFFCSPLRQGAVCIGSQTAIDTSWMNLTPYQSGYSESLGLKGWHMERGSKNTLLV